jgi:hypothetical protein
VAAAKKSEAASIVFENCAPKMNAAMVVPIIPTMKYKVVRNAPHGPSILSPMNQRNQRAIKTQSGWAGPG